MAEIITYSRKLKTDQEKLFATYDLMERFRLRHNQEGLRVKENPLLRPKWKPYFDVYHKKIKWVLHKQSLLRKSLESKLISVAEKKLLPEEQRGNLIDEISGFKREIIESKLYLGKASSLLFDQLNIIKLEDLNPLSPPDPTENFTTYTEEDVVADRVTVTATKCDVIALDLDENVWVYKGGKSFDGDYEHLLTIYSDMDADWERCCMWMIANIIGDYADVDAQSEDGHALRFIRRSTNSPRIELVELRGGSENLDTYTCSGQTIYYPKVKRDEAVGANGTLYGYVYDDSGRESLVDTLTRTLGAKVDFQNIYGMAGNNIGAGGYSFNGYTENLDLQEEEPPVGIPVQAFMYYQRMRRQG